MLFCPGLKGVQMRSVMRERASRLEAPVAAVFVLAGTLDPIEKSLMDLGDARPRVAVRVSWLCFGWRALVLLVRRAVSGTAEIPCVGALSGTMARVGTAGSSPLLAQAHTPILVPVPVVSVVQEIVVEQSPETSRCILLVVPNPKWDTAICLTVRGVRQRPVAWQEEGRGGEGAEMVRRALDGAGVCDVVPRFLVLWKSRVLCTHGSCKKSVRVDGQNAKTPVSAGRRESSSGKAQQWARLRSCVAWKVPGLVGNFRVQGCTAFRSRRVKQVESIMA